MSNNITITIDHSIIEKLKFAIAAALKYEEATSGMRRLGISGEVGEVLACYQLGLKLVADPDSAGYDAVDQDGKHVQIKTRRGGNEGEVKTKGRTSSFSTHEFDYALLVFIDWGYKIIEIWQAEYCVLKPIFEKEKRRNPSLVSFKHVAKKIYSNS